MFAVVGQQPVTPFAQPRERPRHDLATIEDPAVALHPDRAAMRELFERNDLHRSAAPSVRKTRVVDNAAVTEIEAVVGVEESRGDQVRRQIRFALGVMFISGVHDLKSSRR